MPVPTTNPPNNFPALIKRLNHIIRQRALLQIDHIRLQLLRTARARDNRIPKLALQQRVMRHPPKRTLRLRQAMVLRGSAQQVQRIEVLIVPVAAAVRLALPAGLVVAAAGLVARGVVVAVVAARQQAAGDGVVGVEGDAVVAQAGEEFGLDGAVQRVVHALVDGGLDPAVGIAQLADLRHFPRLVVADGEAREVAFFVEVVDGAHGHLVGRRPVRTVQVPHVDFIGLQRFQGGHQVAAQVLRVVRPAAFWGVRLGHLSACGGVELGVHYDPPLLPVQFA